MRLTQRLSEACKRAAPAALVLAGWLLAVTPGHAQQLYFIHTDHLDTPRLISNAAAQTVWMYDTIDPFMADGPDQNPSGLGTFIFNLRFPGQYMDRETWMHYNYFRDYDQEIGRYIQSDPIGLRGGINTYAYVGGNPLSRVDPTGEIVLAIPLLPALPAIGTAIAGGGALGLILSIPGDSASASTPVCFPECNPPRGTVCFFIDRVPPSKPHFPFTGSHYHLFQMNQAPNGKCFWNPLGASQTAPPGAIRCPFERTPTR